MVNVEKIDDVMEYRLEKFEKLKKLLWFTFSCLREGLQWKAHSLTKEVRGLETESLT